MIKIIIDTKKNIMKIIEPLDKEHLERLLRLNDDIELEGDYKILREIIENNITDTIFLEKIEKLIRKAKIDYVRVDMKKLKEYYKWETAVKCLKYLQKFGWTSEENLEVIKKAIEETFYIISVFSDEYAEDVKFLLQSEIKNWWMEFLKNKINNFIKLKYLWGENMLDDLMLSWIKQPYMFSSFKGLLAIFKGILDSKTENYFKEEIEEIKRTYEKIKKLADFDVYNKLIKNLTNEPSYKQEIVTFFRIIGDVSYIKYLL
jgi:DNA mismatch repair ATPase MutS